MTVIPFLPAVAVTAALVIDTAAKQLAADVKLAMKRADLSIDWVSRVIHVPPNKLSDQLNAKAPFTAFWRFFIEEMRETDFLRELLDIQAERVDRVCVKADLGGLPSRLEALVHKMIDVLVEDKQMAKASLHEQREEKSA